MPLKRQLGRLQSAILEHPRGVLAASALVVVVALLLGLGVEFRTSRAELGAPDDPDQLRWNALLDDYAGAEALIACVESRSVGEVDEAGLRRYVDRLAAAFESDPLVEHVFHRVDLEWFMRRGLFLAPADSLVAAVEGLTRERETLDRLPSIDGFADLNELLAERIERGLSEGLRSPTDGEDSDAAGEEVLRTFLEAQRRFLDAPLEAVEEWTAVPAPLRFAGSDPRAATDGYLKTRDGHTWFLVISRRDPGDGLAAYRELMASMTARVAEASADQPGYRVVFTGQPAIVVEEMDTVRADTWRTSILAVIGVGLLTFLVFRWRSHAVLVLLALAAGLAWSFGAVRLELGYLNLITSSFLSTLVGVGVAYGIHPVSEYELEGAHTGEPTETVRKAYHRTGAAVTTAAVTTAVAFFSILLMRFPGFAELGLVAGVGVLLCLLAALTTLPALLTVYGQWRHRRDRVRRDGAMSSAVDRFWIERVAGRICKAPALVVGLAVLVTAAMGWLATGIGFNTNFFDLLPRNAESLRYQEVMATQSDLSPLFNIVAAEDVAELRELSERAAREPTIARFESLLQFLPEDPVASTRAVAELRDAVADLRLPEAPGVLDPAGLADSLRRLEAALAEVSDAAFGAGLAETAGAMEDARGQAELALGRAIDASPEDVRAWEEGQARLLAWLADGLRWLREATEVTPPTPAGLPYEIRERFLTRSGKPLAFLFPAGDIFDPDDLQAFASASRRVSPETTGFPMVFSKSSRRIVDGFNVAVLVGALLVLVILYLDFRDLKKAVLAIVPLAIGVVWMLGGMRLCGISFNFANLVAVPLIIGVGIDNGVHVIQRLRLEGRDGMGVVLRHTGRAIVISSLTTMVGFGSLAIASHRGMSSLGTVLLLGVGACLLTSTVVLPNLLVLTGQVKR